MSRRPHLAGVVEIACATALLAGAARAQTFTTLVRDGDMVPGVGQVTAIHTFAVNDTGTWVASAYTDASLEQNVVLLRDGVLLLHESQMMPGASGYTLQAFDGVSINAAGNSCWNLFLHGGVPPHTETALYVNQTPLRRVGDPITSGGFTPGTPYVSFSEVVYNDAGDAFLIANVDDPQIPGLNDQVAVKLDLSGRALIGETTVLRRYDTPAALGGDAVTDIERDPGELALGEGGEVAYVVRTSSGRSALMLDTTVVARETEAAPEQGRRWETLTSRPLDLNAHGALLFRADLDGDASDDEVVVLHDAGRSEIVMREGSPVTTPDGVFHVTGFGGAPVRLTDGNDVVVYAKWDDPDPTRDSGLFYNGRLVVQEGVTRVEGALVVSLGEGVPTLFSTSPSGDFLAFQCMLEGFVDALVLADTSSLPGAFCDASDGSAALCPCSGGGAVAGCEIASGTGGVRLRVESQRSAPLNRATLVGSGFPAMSFTPNVLLRSTGRGSAVVFGNGLRCVGLPVTRVSAKLSSLGTTTHAFGHGAAPGTFAYQLWFRDMPLSYCDPTAAFNLSGGRELVWP